jgi:hypothetical protein
VYLAFLFGAPSYLVGAIAYHANQNSTSVIVALCLALVSQNRELTRNGQRLLY